jgi:hypothetical protein
MSNPITPRETLAQQQNDLLASIFAPSADSPVRGLAVYRANSHASAQRALQAAYPVIAQLVGDENFGYLARDFWQQHPPGCGDLAQWGSLLPVFLAASRQLADTPYLADVAQIEWQLHVCAGAADRSQDTASFAALTQQDPEYLSFTIAPGMCLLPSAYPATAIALAHKGQSTMQDAAALLQNGVAQTALLWRHGFAPRLRVLHEAEHAFTSAVCAGQNLMAALSLAHAGFDFNSWLTATVRDGLVLGITVRNPPPLTST